MAQTRKVIDAIDANGAAPSASPYFWTTYVAPLFGKKAADVAAKSEAARQAEVNLDDELDPFDARYEGRIEDVRLPDEVPPIEAMPAEIWRQCLDFQWLRRFLFSFLLSNS